MKILKKFKNNRLLRRIVKKIPVLMLLVLFQASYFYVPVWEFLGLGNQIPQAHAANANGLVVYGDNGSATPSTRSWDGSAFGANGSAATAVATIQYTVNKEAPTRSENIVGTSATTGVTTFQVYNGSWGNAFSSTPGVSTTNDAYRGFDISYEQISGDGLVVYEDNSSANTNIKYNTWNGSAWGGEQSLTVNSANILWARMESKPLTNEIMLVTLDSNSDIYAYVWNGSGWGSGQLLTASASVNTSNPFDLAYENTSGDAMVAYGTGTTWNYWTYISSTWTDGTGGSNCAGDGTTNACANVAGSVVNLNLTSSSENNYIAVAIDETTGDDFMGQMWDGSQWLALPSAITTWDEAGAVENAASEMPQNVTYEANGNRFMFMYVLSGLLTAQYFFYDLDDSTWYNGDGTTSITDIDSVTTTTGANTTTDDMEWINFASNPDDASQIMLTVADILGVVRSRLWNGSSWSTPTNGDHGDAGTVTFGSPASFAWNRTINVTTVGTSGSQTTSLPITATDKHVGGAFTFINSAATANVTSIKISEKGNVNANSNLTNVKLLYKQEATCSSTVPSGTTQFGSTGTFNGSDESTFTGTMSVGTSQVCVYVTFDIGSGASVSQTMEIEITAPQSDVTSAADAVIPSTTVAISGTSTLANPVLTVSDPGTQKVEMGIPSADNYIGAAFTFIRDAGTTSVTSIKINEEGTVAADTELSNVVIWYKQETSCSSTVPTDATQFNSSAGTFNASDQVTVTGTMSVGTSQVCVYVKLNILAAADDGDTLEIEITNPSTDVVVSSNTVTPATPIALAGTTTLSIPDFTSYGAPFLYTQAGWGGGSGTDFFYEVYWRKTTGNVYMRVYDETSSAEVTDSLEYISDATFVRTRTSALTLIDGHVYRAQLGHVTGAAGEVYSARFIADGTGGGADLAEYYTSKDTLGLADVVSIDSSKVASVKHSTSAYQGDVLGIVSTQPGMTLGANVGQSYPIALVGRVPVKVTTENGQIKVGDFVTASSTKGYGMKATKAGRVLGQALEAFDPTKTHKCPEGTNESLKCGTVMVFVNLTNFFGESMDVVMALAQSSEQSASGLSVLQESQSLASGLSSSDTNIFIPSFQAPDKESQILAFLKLSQKQASVSAKLSEIFIDRLSVTTSIITPKIITDILYAKNIKADHIDGLDLITDRISSLEAKVSTIGANLTSSPAVVDQQKLLMERLTAELNNASKSAILTQDNVNLTSLSSDGLARLDSLEARQASISGNLRVKGNGLIEGILTVIDTLTTNNFIVNGLSTFFGDVVFKGNVKFDGTATFGNDVGGNAVITKDTKRVEIVFDKEFEQIPIINASVSFDEQKDKDGKVIPSDELEQAFFDQGYSYIMVNKSARGFTIVLNKKARDDVTFTWTAIRVKNAKTIQSRTPN